MVAPVESSQEGMTTKTATIYVVLLAPVFFGFMYAWDKLFYGLFNFDGLWGLLVGLLCSLIVRYTYLNLSASSSIVPSFLLMLFSVIVNGISSASCTYLHKPGDLLFDIGFELLPELSKASALFFLPDALSFILFGISIGVFIRSDPNDRLKFCVRMMRLMAINYLFRAFSVVVTSLPGPAMHCRKENFVQSSFLNWGDVFSHTSLYHGLANNCGDLIYSGHTSFTVIMITTIILYMPLNRVPFYRVLYNVVGGIMLSIVIVFIIAGRRHYTVDCVIGLYMGYGLSHIFGESLTPVGWVLERERDLNKYEPIV